MKIVVYTSLYGNCGDVLMSPVANPIKDGDTIDYVCFTDRSMSSSVYLLENQSYTLGDLRRASRWSKINSHLAFADADVTIWHDAIYQVKNVYDILNESDGEFCTFRHYRTRLEDEIEACVKWGKEMPEVLQKQLAYYQQQGMPETDVLFDCSCVVRRNTSKVKEINELWWSQFSKFGCRDQISLPYVFWQLKYKGWKALPGSRENNPFFLFREHNCGNLSV
jgi:hypothetical protein